MIYSDKISLKFQSDEPLNLYCNAGTAILGSAAIGAVSSIFGASKASKAQQNAAAMSISAQKQMYDTTRADLAPYRDIGSKYGTELDRRMPELTSDIDVSAELRDPNSTIKNAYDFTRTQGLKAAQNSAAARGLGVSGAALKGASSFATGLADNTYQNLFNMERANRTDAYTRLKGLVDTGAAAAGATGTIGSKTADAISSSNAYSGNAQANAYNAMGQAGKQFASDVGGYAAYKGMYGGNKDNDLIDDVYF